jgi:hypothetical protein
MKRSIKVAIALLSFARLANAQTPDKALSSFDKVIVSPLVSLILVAGEQESIKLQYENIEPDKVNYIVQNKTLHIYLDDAKITVKNQKWRDGDQTYQKPIYEKDVKVTAYVTYKQLKSLDVRGEEETTCRDELASDVFKLRVYGQAKVTVASLKARKLKAAFYGENKVTILSGQAVKQRYRVYGDNEIDTENLIGQNVSAHSYGESQLRVNASNRMGVMALGESDIRYAGGAHLRKGLVLGDVTIRRAE